MSDKRLTTKSEIALNLRGADAALDAAERRIQEEDGDGARANIAQARRFLRYAKAVHATGRKTLYIRDLDKLFHETE